MEDMNKTPKIPDNNPQKLGTPWSAGAAKIADERKKVEEAIREDEYTKTVEGAQHANMLRARAEELSLQGDLLIGIQNLLKEQDRTIPLFKDEEFFSTLGSIKKAVHDRNFPELVSKIDQALSRASSLEQAVPEDQRESGASYFGTYKVMMGVLNRTKDKLNELGEKRIPWKLIEENH